MFILQALLAELASPAKIIAGAPLAAGRDTPQKLFESFAADPETTSAQAEPRWPGLPLLPLAELPQTDPAADHPLTGTGGPPTWADHRLNDIAVLTSAEPGEPREPPVPAVRNARVSLPVEPVNGESPGPDVAPPRDPMADPAPVPELLHGAEVRTIRVPAPASGRSDIIPRTSEPAWNARANPEAAAAVPRSVETPTGDEPVAAPRQAPPVWAPSRGLNARPETARTTVETPARSDTRVPVVPSGNPDKAPVVAELATAENVDIPPPARDASQGEEIPFRQPSGPARAVEHVPLAHPATPPPASDIARREVVRGAPEASPRSETSTPVTPDRPDASRTPPPFNPPGLARPESRPSAETRDPGPSAALHDFAPAEDTRHTHDTGRLRSDAVSVRPVIGQVIQAIARNLPDGVVEVRLQPEELGRLRLAISQVESGYVVQVTAERGETLDLVRRHIDLLATDLKERGFGNLEFSFGHGSQPQGDLPDAPDTADTVQEIPGNGISAHLATRLHTVQNGRLDMRL